MAEILQFGRQVKFPKRIEYNGMVGVIEYDADLPAYVYRVPYQAQVELSGKASTVEEAEKKLKEQIERLTR